MFSLVNVLDWIFFPNQSNLFRNLYPSQSELIRINPKEVFNFVWCKSVDNISDLIRVNPRLRIRMIKNQFFNPNETEVEIIRIEDTVKVILTSDSVGLEVSDWVGFNRNEFFLGLKISDWIELIFSQIALNEIEIFFWIDSEWIGINLIGSE